MTKQDQSKQVERKPQIGIMKAHTLEEPLVKALGETCFVQPKFRGQHARTSWINGKPILISSYGHPFFFLSHIEEALAALPQRSYVGELYCHDLSQQEINSILNRTVNPHPDAARIHYVIFDIAIPGPQTERFMILDLLNLPLYRDAEAPIRYASYELRHSAHWMRKCAEYISHGYEGIILRSLRNEYAPLDPHEQAKRPRSILKFKPNETDTYQIIGTVEGTGWAKGMLGSFEVEDDNGVTFFVGTGPCLTKRERARLWEVRSTLPGKSLLVKHEPISAATADGKPICTRAIRVL